MKRYLTVKEVLYIHNEIIEEFGGKPGVRDSKTLGAAVMRPQTGYYNDLVEEGAALMESLAMNHPFYDENKRVSFFVADIFFRLNGYFINCDYEKAGLFYNNNLGNNSFRFEVIVEWLRENLNKT